MKTLRGAAVGLIAMGACGPAAPPAADIEPQSPVVHMTYADGAVTWTSATGRYLVRYVGWTQLPSPSVPLELESRSSDGRLRMCDVSEQSLDGVGISQSEANQRTSAMTANGIGAAISGASGVEVSHRELSDVSVADMRYQQAGFQFRRLMLAIAGADAAQMINLTCGVQLPADASDIAAMDAVLDSLTLLD